MRQPPAPSLSEPSDPAAAGSQAPSAPAPAEAAVPVAGPPRLDRRTFLGWSAAFAATGPFLSSSPAAAQLPVLPLSVGFVEGSELWRKLDRVQRRLLQAREAGEGALRALPAHEMIAGDQMLANETVRMRVHGLYPGLPTAGARLEKLDLTVLFPSDDPLVPGPFPFFAWSYRGWPAPSPSPGLSFVVPLGLDGSLRLELDVVPHALSSTTRRASLGAGSERPVQLARYATDFTVDWYDGRPKLQRGVYLLGFHAHAWHAARGLPGDRQARRMGLASLVVSFDRA